MEQNKHIPSFDPCPLHAFTNIIRHFRIYMLVKATLVTSDE